MEGVGKNWEEVKWEKIDIVLVEGKKKLLYIYKKKKWGASLQRFSFSFSGIDFVEDVFVTSPDD